MSRGTTFIYCLLALNSLYKYKAPIWLIYCGFDNEYQLSSCPTNIIDMFSTRLRDHFSNHYFCFFSATEALCGKIDDCTFSRHCLFNYLELKLSYMMFFDKSRYFSEHFQKLVKWCWKSLLFIKFKQMLKSKIWCLSFLAV